MDYYQDSEIINIGCGEDISIRDLSILIKTIVGNTGEVVWNTAMPDGTPRKLLDVAS
jgi:GDP-L-fucose synthase